MHTYVPDLVTRYRRSLLDPFLQASRKVQAGDVQPSELAEACIEQMERSSWLNCFVTECADSARLEARAADLRQARGKRNERTDGRTDGRMFMNACCSRSSGSAVPVLVTVLWPFLLCCGRVSAPLHERFGTAFDEQAYFLPRRPRAPGDIPSR